MQKLSAYVLPVFCIALPHAMGAAEQLAASNPQLQSARTAYFTSLEGGANDSRKARNLFADLNRLFPGSPLVEAYEGSLDLLDAARTWEVWNKHDLAQRGLAKLDQAVKDSPESIEVRFIRGATTLHLPFFFHRRQQAEEDFAFIAPRAEAAAQQGQLPPPIAAAALNYYGQILTGRKDFAPAQEAFRAAQRVAPQSPAGRDAASQIHE